MIARGLYRLLARDEYNSFKVVRDLEGVREVVEVKVEVVVNSGKSVVVVDVVVVVVVVIKLAFLIVVYSSPSSSSSELRGVVAAASSVVRSLALSKRLAKVTPLESCGCCEG